jgi:TP901 family phage tail tape measure protein
VSSEIGDLFVTLRAVTDPYTGPMTDAAGIGEDATSRIMTAASQMAASLDESAQLAAAAFKSILDAATELAEGLVEPLAAVKTSVRQVASAVRALGTAATGAEETAAPAFDAISASADQMATVLDAALATAQASVAGLDAEFTAAAVGATTAATEMKAAGAEGAAAATEAGDAAAASAGESSAALDGTAGALSKYVLGLAATGVGLFEAVKGATQFNGVITQLNTQAGVSKTQLASLGDGALDLAGQVGQNPDSLAESLLHVESNFESMGISGANALNIVKIAAEGATTGHADLVDVTNTLTAAVASGIPGVQNMGQAMGQLNAIVGSGDMKMQDLADAFGSGMVATVKGFGLSLTDVGAALATFGDNNIRGAVAGTDLRMTVQALAAPVSTAGAELDKLGLKQNTLAQDMQKGGLKLALEDLMKHMKDAGVTADQQGAVITEVFGKKAGSGINVLTDQMDRFESKYPAITAGANSFGDAWKTASQTTAVEFDQLKSGLEAMGIKLGQMLLPYITKFLGWIRDGVSWVTSHKAAMEGLAAVLGGVLLTAVVSIAGAVATMSAPFTLAEVAIAAVGAAIFYAYTHFKTFREIVNDVASFLKAAFVVAWHAAGAVIDWFRTTVLPALKTAIKDVIDWFNSHKEDFKAAWDKVMHDVQVIAKWFDDNVLKWVEARVAELVTWWHDHSQEISEVWSVLWKGVSDEVSTIWDGVIKPLLSTIAGFWALIWGVIRDTVETVWKLISDVITTALHLIENVIGLVLDVITGNWGRAWKDLKSLVSDAFTDVLHFIGDAVSGFGTLLYDAGANLIKGLINGIGSMIGGITSTISGIAKTVRDYWPFSPAKTGPLSGSGSMDIAGAKIGGMLASGMHSSAGVVTQAAARLAGIAAGAGGAAIASGPAGGFLPSAGGTGALTIGGSGAGLEALAVALSSAGASAPADSEQLPPIVVQVDGRELFKIMQTQALRNGRRNPTTGLVYST